MGYLHVFSLPLLYFHPETSPCDSLLNVDIQFYLTIDNWSNHQILSLYLNFENWIYTGLIHRCMMANKVLLVRLCTGDNKARLKTSLVFVLMAHHTDPFYCFLRDISYA
ncbi:hypothetical protein RF11_05725 [Thelohanellus kitauei]|uniref:Uncharacterized protein n=1 Tax=Thelohanellus kitauei TaxID=669202 RepID=A0A0C2NBG7_THEKT|nr:hypothetical protein RF11_05725 [Thelohanellus kitauei]